MVLHVNDLHAYYGKSHILQGVTFDVGEGEIVTLLGRNGSGRSTTLKSVQGLVQPSSGTVKVDGADLAGHRSCDIARAGVAYVPEERDVFANLTVDENLRLGVQASGPGRPAWTIDEMFDFFPRLRERASTQAGRLSGGEQQMLTMCRSLLGNPRIILIDEPTEGLAPKIVEQVMELILEIQRRGVAVLLVEQKLTIALKIAHRVLVMGHGHIAFSGTREEFADRPDVRRDWLEVS